MRAALTILSIVCAVSCAGSAAAQCRVAAAGACAIDLRGESAPRASAVCAAEAWQPHLAFQLPDRFADGDADGWHETVLEVALEPKLGCRCAVFRIVFEGEPSLWSVNVGDSPTNNGFGGDSWSTKFDAELMLLHSDLTAFGPEKPDSLSESQIFSLRDLPLADRVLELEICDQFVRFAIDPGAETPGLSGFFNSSTSRELLAIRPAPPEAAAAAAAAVADDDDDDDAPDARIYAAFNRVIHRRAGRPSRDRFGRGVRRVEVSLSP